jgi:hypothetical protein
VAVETFVPKGAWQVDYDLESCHLARAFTHGDDTLVLSFNSYSSGSADLHLVGKETAKVSGGNKPVFLRWGDQPAVRLQRVDFGTSGTDPILLTTLQLPKTGREAPSHRLCSGKSRSASKPGRCNMP